MRAVEDKPSNSVGSGGTGGGAYTSKQEKKNNKLIMYVILAYLFLF